MDFRLKQILTEEEEFQNKDIQIVPNLFFNQARTIKRIYFYYNSKFETGEVDAGSQSLFCRD